MFRRKQKPININDLSNQHFVTALVALCAEENERHRRTVVSQHLPGIAHRHLSISNLLDSILDAHENLLWQAHRRGRNAVACLPRR